MNALPKCLVLSSHVTGLWITRALGRRGVLVTVLPMDDTDLGRYSRWAAGKEHVFAGDVEELAAFLLSKADVWMGNVLIPAGDLALETLSRHRGALSSAYRLCVPPWETVRLLLCKNETARIAAICGIEVPVNYGAVEAVIRRRSGLRWPVVIKPNDSYRFQLCFGKKLFVSGSADEFDTQVTLVQEACIEAQVQELIPGPDSLSFNYTAYFDASGRRVAEFPMRKLRKSPPYFGIGRVIETLDDGRIIGELREKTAAFVREARWHGPVSAEFKLDPRDGCLLLIEVNGRCSFVQQLALRGGVDYAWLAYQEAAWGEVTLPSASGWSGVLIHLHADLLNTLFFRKIEALTLKQLVTPYFRRKTFAVWSASDPFPFLAEWGRTLRESFQLATSPEKRKMMKSRVVAIRQSAETFSERRG
jgi:D-aspartate ligase